MMRREVVIPLLILCLLSSDLVRIVDSIWLTLPSSVTKCISDEIHPNVVVLADYIVVTDQSYIPSISCKVSSPYGKLLHRLDNVTHGQFAFTTNEAGNYLACFWITDRNYVAGSEININVDWKVGIAAKDWETVAKKEKIEGVELELKKLEGAVESIHENLLYLKDREALMWMVSETTNARVALYSIASLGICIVASTVQVWYLKRFFQKKKLI